MDDSELKEQLDQLKADHAALQLQLHAAQAPIAPKAPEICRVSVKLPPFWPDKPAVWFAQVEAQFEIAGISADNTMYNYVIGHLDQKLAGEIEDIITRPPAIGERYPKLKEELIRRLSMSEEQRVRQLISDEELGDRRPSQFLRHLRSLSGTALTDQNILRQLWMRRLPQQVQAIIASQPDLSLDKLAELADKVIELTGPRNQIYSCSTPATSSTVLDNLVHRVEELGRQVASLTTMHHRGRSRDRSANSSRQPNQRSRSGTPSKAPKMCWYHKRFAAKATKCVSPCTWNSTPTQENSGNSQ